MDFAASQRLRGAKVLVVEDDEDSRELMCELLRLAGAQVEGAQSTRDALELFAAFAPDVLVSDIGLPIEDGYALVRKLRALEEARGSGPTPAIALTGYTPSEQSQAGFQAHLIKPVEPDKLIDVILQQLRREKTFKADEKK